MKLTSYVKDNLGKVGVYLIMVILVLAVLAAFKADQPAVACVGGVMGVFGLLLFFYDFVRKRKFYSDMHKIMQKLDKKYLLAEMLEAPEFLEGRLLFDVLSETDKASAEEVGDYRRQLKGFREYIEMWVHEIKTPLTGLSLKLRAEDRAVKIYLEEMGNYIDQALYYSKIDTIEKDYVIKRVSLEKVVNNVIRRNKDNLIMSGAKVVADDLGVIVHSDAKWLEFVVNQVVSNAIKYRNTKPELLITAEKTTDGIILKMRDNGMGIRKSELRRVFDKGFTGSNDRKTKASTGMGLYISHELCRGLGHDISIISEHGKFTEVTIRFGGGDFYLTES